MVITPACRRLEGRLPRFGGASNGTATVVPCLAAVRIVSHRRPAILSRGFVRGAALSGGPNGHSGPLVFAGCEGYYERTVRADQGPQRIREYITNNPALWDLDAENPGAAGANTGVCYRPIWRA